MKKNAYALAVACLLLGAIGIAGGSVYRNIQKDKEATEEAKEQVQPSEIQTAKQEKTTETAQPELEDLQTVEPEDLAQNVTEETEETAETTEAAETVEVTAEVEPARHFDTQAGLFRPVEGAVLLDYSMDTTIYFPTLQQYRYHPAIVLKADVNDEVVVGAAGVITEVKETAETGLTVTVDFGDGYHGIYGQLKDLNFEKGEEIEAGQVLGYVNETTKYYAVEGDNVYFALTKDEKPQNPMDYFTE